MKFRVLENITLKTGNGNIELREGQTVEVQPEKVSKLVEAGKLCPLPSVDHNGTLIIPFNSPPEYHWWNRGQDICTTLKELGRCDLIERYKSPYSN